MKFISPFLILLAFNVYAQNFEADQKRYKRVRDALKTHEVSLIEKLQALKVSKSSLQVFLKAHKFEQELEIWVKNKADSTFQRFETIPFCTFSGSLGPKRKQGDFQIPEGFYHIDRFNPFSSFHLSMGINYPNTADRILGQKGNLGGDIFLHGNCVSIGCISITDEIISWVYVMCIWAKSNGQSSIPVHIYPFKMHPGTVEQMENKLTNLAPFIPLWKQLEKMYQFFEKNKYPSDFKVNNRGDYVLY